MANFIDFLGDAGYGMTSGFNAVNNAYQNMDKARESNVGATRKEAQLGADTAQDIFNATALENRARLENQTAGNQLKTAQTGDALDYYNPQTRAVVGQMAQSTGGADTPEFQRAYADYLAGRGMTNAAAPAYDKAATLESIGQQVAATLRQNPEYADVDTVEQGADGKIYGFTTPDERGEYMAVQLPQEALRQYSALAASTKGLAYDLKMRQAEMANQAAGAKEQEARQKAMAVQGAAQNQRLVHEAALAKAQGNARLTDEQVAKAWQEMVKLGVTTGGLTFEEAKAQASQELRARGYGPQPVAGPASGMNPADIARLFGGASTPAAGNQGVTGSWGATPVSPASVATPPFNPNANAFEASLTPYGM